MIPLRDKIPSQTFPFVTVLLIIINLVIFIYEVSLGPQLRNFIEIWGATPSKIINIQSNNPLIGLLIYSSLLTSIFLHGGWFHVIGNMWYLWIFGDNVEDSMGHARFFLFYLLCGLGAGLGHVFLNPESCRASDICCA